MKLHRRVARVIANEGFTGLATRLIRTQPEAPAVTPEKDQIKEDFFRLAREFVSRTQKMGRPEVNNYYWYHTIDLGDGLVTPGTYDYRGVLDLFRFPEDMHGMSALDVGSATGFFAFEFERRGARVVSLELPSLEALDRFPSHTLEQSTRNLNKVIKELEFLTPEQSATLESKSTGERYEILMDGPFKFCHEQLKSKVERHYARLYDLTPEVGSFDLVFVGDVLVHTINPLQALSNVAALCRNKLIIAQDTAMFQDCPAFQYIGGDGPDDNISWWLPNEKAFEQILKKMGFARVEVVGKHVGQFRPMGLTFNRTIIHATR